MLVGVALLSGGAAEFATTNREAMRHFWLAAEAKTRPVTVLSFGDSMADSWRSPTYHLMRKLDDRLGVAGCSMKNYRNLIMWQMAGGTSLIPYSTNWFADHFAVPPGGALWWENQNAAGGVVGDEAGIYYVRQPRGGLFTLSVSTNAGPWGVRLTLDGFSPTPIGCFTNLTLPLNSYRLRVNGLSGTNYIIGPQVKAAHTNGLHVSFLDQDGIALREITNVPVAIRAPIFAALKPDLLIWHMKEDGSPVTSNRLEACESWWSNSVPGCDVLYVGTPYIVFDSTNTFTPLQNEVVRGVALKHGRAYVDLMQPGISYESLTANGLLHADGVHLSATGGEWGGAIMWNDMNFFALGLPRSLALQSFEGSPRVTFSTAAGAIYGLQSSSNLVDWTLVMTLVGGNGQVTFYAPAVPRQFYRLQLTPAD